MPNQSDKEFNGCQNDTFETTKSLPTLVHVNNNAPDYLALFKAISTIIVDKDGSTYYHSPYYFKDTGNGEIFEMFLLEDLPESVKELLPKKD